MQNVVLHPGAHKTGTSLVQKYMRDRRDMLAAVGVMSLPRSEGDRLIRWGAAQDVKAGQEQLNQAIRVAEIAGCEHFVISHENTLGAPFVAEKNTIYPRLLERARNLKNALSRHNIVVVYYIRSQAQFLESYYLQTIHEGKDHTFKAWRRQVGKPNLSWRPVYENLCEVFGKESVILRSFDDDISQGQAVYLERFFSSFMNVDADAFGRFEYAPVRNPSIGAKGLKIARAVNGLLETSRERKSMRRFLQDNFSNIDYPRPVLLRAAQISELGQKYGAENSDLIARSIEARGSKQS
jgi:hypothetical protein